MADGIRRKRSVLGNWMVKHRRKPQNTVRPSFRDERRESGYETPPIDYSDDDNYSERSSLSLKKSRRTSAPIFIENRPSSPKGRRTNISTYEGNDSSSSHGNSNALPHEINHPSSQDVRRKGIMSYVEGTYPSSHSDYKALSASSYDVSRFPPPRTRKAPSISSYDSNYTTLKSRSASSVSIYETFNHSSQNGRTSPSVQSYEENRPFSPSCQKTSNISSNDENRPSPSNGRQTLSVSFDRSGLSPPNSQRPLSVSSYNKTISVPANRRKSRSVSSSDDDSRESDGDSNDGYFTPPVDYSDNDRDKNDTDEFESDLEFSPQHKVQLKVSFRNYEEKEERKFQRPLAGADASTPKRVPETSPQVLNRTTKKPELPNKPSSVSVLAKKPSRVRFSNVDELETSSDDSELIDKVYADSIKMHLPVNEIDHAAEESEAKDSQLMTPVNYESMPQLFTGLTKTAALPGPAVGSSEEMKWSVDNDDAKDDAADPSLKLPAASTGNDLSSWIAASVQKANAYKKKLMKEKPPDIFDEASRCGGMDDGGSSLSSASYGSCSSSGAEEVVLRIHVPELSVERCLTFHSHDLVWTVKQAALTSLPKELRESFNYGLFCPPQNGRAGKFLDEERPLSDYPLCSPLGYLELKYKRRVYKMLKLEEKTLRALHSRANLRRFLEWVKEGNVEKVAKMCSKGLDPNFHDQETGDTPLTIAARGHLKVRKGCAAMLVALVNGGALLDYRTREGLTAMHRAVQADNLHAVRTLLDLGASPNYRDHRGLTPLYYCVTHAKDPLVCEALLHDYAIIGVADHQGWQETHQACRNKLVQHLEHLLFYGADLNGRNASGNTPLHVCAVNNLEDCARVLLFRGCDKNALNYANQNPYQVAVISGNLELAEIINKHQPEDIVPFKSPPRYNPRRRVSGAPLLRATSDPRLENPCVHKPPSPAPSSRSIPPFSSASSLSEASTGSGSTASNNSSNAHPGDCDHDSHSGYDSRTQPTGGGDAGRETFSDTSSGICSSYHGSGSDGLPSRPGPHPYQPNNVHGNVAEADEEEDEESESESNNSSSSSEGSGNGGGVSCLTYDVGTLVVCVKQQIAVDSSQLSLNLGDIVQVSGSTDDGLLEGTTRGLTGTFPPSCVQQVRLRNPHSGRDSFAQQQLIRTKSHSGYGADLPPAPHAGATHYGTAPRARKTQMPLSRTVVLHRGKKGFGFVLRGAKAMSPLMERLGDKGAVALQYLDDVDPDGVADLAGLKKGDYLLKINGEDVSQASHEHVVSLIRKSADLVEMTVVTPTAGVLPEAPPTSFSPQKPPFISNNAVRGSQTLPRKHNFSRSASQANTPPAPPPRDPSTSLSVGRARARSVVGSLQQHSADSSESLSPSSSSGLPKLASIKARPASALRMTASQVEEMISQNSAGSLPPSPSNSSSDARPPRVYASVAEMKKAKALRSRPPADSRLHKVFHSTPDLTPAPAFTAPGALSSDLSLQSYPGNSMTLNHPNSRHSMADPPQEEYSGSSPATGFFPKRVSQYDGAMHGSLDHRRLKRSQSAINSSQLMRDDGTVSPNAGAGQLVKVDISRSSSEYASVAQSVKSPGDPDSSPTSPGIMSSFRPSDSAKLYASPEEIKSVGYRNPQMLAQLNRVKNSNYATSAKSRSQSLPPTTNRPPVSRLHSDPYAEPMDKAASQGDSPIDDDDLPLPPPPPEAELITYAKPQNNRIVADANYTLMTTSCIVDKSGPICDQSKQMSASFTGPSSSQYTSNCGYSSEEENTYNSQYGDELNSRTIKRKKHSVAFAPNLVKSEDNIKSKEASHYAAPVASTAATTNLTASSTSSLSKPNPADRAENFSDLIAKKAEERRARLENGGNSSAPSSANSSPNRKTIPPKANKGLSDAILESALFNKQKEKVSNGDNVGSTEAKVKTGSVANILQKMKNSKSFPSELTQEDGENSSSGVSSDQEIQQDGSFVTVINTESNSISEAKPKPVMPKSNSVEEFSVSSESSEDASDRTCILTNDKTSTESSSESTSLAVSKRPGTRSRNVAYVSKLPGSQDSFENLPSVAAAKKNGTTVKIVGEEAIADLSSSNHSLPASHPLATSQPLPGHLQEAIHPSNTHVGQAKFSTLQRPQSNSKRFTKAGSDPPSGQNYASGGTLIRSRSINRDELNLNSGSATLDRNFYQANKGGNSSGKAEYERSIDESLQLIRMHMNSLNEVNSLAGIKASHPLNENLRETNSLSPNANKEPAGARVEEVLAPPPQFSDTSGGQFRRNGSEEPLSGRVKPSVLREDEDESDLPIRVVKRSNRRVEEEFVAAADDGRSFRYKTLDEWSTKDTTDWLESLFMPEYKDSFETKQIDGAKLLKINNESLINLGVRRVGHRVNMEKSLKRYRPIERIDL